MHKISVIMPAYNVEAYIREAVQSVQSQTYSNWELIIVDDGSTDHTLKIIQELAEAESRIIYATQQNMGASSARNAALDLATGEFIMFLDSDDWFADQYVFENCVKSMNSGCELTEFNACCYENGQYSQNFLLNKPISPQQSMRIKCPDNKYCAAFYSVWSGCFLRSIIEQYQLRFPIGLIFQDWQFSISYTTHCSYINFINEAFYIYRSHPTSTTRKMGMKAFDIFTVYNAIKTNLMQCGLWNGGGGEKKLYRSQQFNYDV